MSADPAKKLQTLIKKLPVLSGSGSERPLLQSHTVDPIVGELVRSFFIWECGCRAADMALDEVHAATVDYNELRVALPHEFHRLVSVRDEHAAPRFLRLRSALNEIYRREHEISLSHLGTLAKRDARAYLDSLDGMHPFVSARVCLLSLGAHAFPADGRLCTLLAREKALPPELDPLSPSSHGDAGSWLEHHILADDSRDAYLRLELWADQELRTPAPKVVASSGPVAKSRPKGRSKAASDASGRTTRKRSAS